MADQLVRLGMAVSIIALISIALYQFSGESSPIDPAAIRNMFNTNP